MKFKLNGQEYFIKPDITWWDKYWKYAAGVTTLVILSFLLFGCTSGSVETVPTPVTISCTGTYQGAIVLPDHEERVRAFNESRARGETNLGGGVDGGFYLEGSMNLVTDTSCNMQGEFIIHGQTSKATGHVNTDGTFSGMHEGGPFEGKVEGKVITGMIFEGGGREYLQVTQPESLKIPFIFGRLNGSVS
jgi:hypothetical protein